MHDGSLQLHPYHPTSFHDWLLVDLWGKMQRSGDLEKTMLRGSQALFEFMKVLARPDTYFAYDDSGPYFVAWCEPVMCGVALGFWVREDKRASRACLQLAHMLLNKLFQKYPTIVVITKDPAIQHFHQHFGFQFVGEIPHIYDGERAYISALTQEQYFARYPASDEALSYTFVTELAHRGT